MEGLYHPLEVPLADGVDRDTVFASLVRIHCHRTVAYTPFATAEEAKAHTRWQIEPDGSEMLSYGVPPDIRARLDEPELAAGLFTRQLVELLRDGAQLPQRVVLRGTGSGVVVSARGHVLTNRHLVTGPIAALGRTAGVFGRAERCPHLTVDRLRGFDADGNPRWEPFPEVELVSHPGEGGPETDWALLQVDDTHPAHLTPGRRAGRFDRVWSYGTPMATLRPAERRRALGYADADDGLRTSVGLVARADPGPLFLTDLDGGPGSSGSPTVDAEGRLAGLYCGSVGSGLARHGDALRRHVHAEVFADHLPG